MLTLLNKLQDLLDFFRSFDFLAPLAIRLYLFMPFWMAGTTKFGGADKMLSGDFSDLKFTAQWFEHSLQLPLPQLMAFLAATTETLGAVMLLAGFGVRWVSIPLIVTMLVAIFAVHWNNGWYAIGETPEATQRLEAATSLLQEHGHYEWLTETGRFVVLNDGIEFATTYLIMLLVLFFMGAGKYFSLDYYIAKRFRR